MKKIMMTRAAIAVAATMNAQGYIGGTLGFDFQNKLVDKDGEEATGMFFQIKPELGYNLDDKSSVGITLGLSMTNNGNKFTINNQPQFAGHKMDKTALQFEVAPYYRYKFMQFDKIDIFVDAYAALKYTKYDEWNNTTFGLGVRPGVAFNANDKFSFVAKLGAGLFFESSKDKDSESIIHFGLQANTLAPLEIGMYYNF